MRTIIAAIFLVFFVSQAAWAENPDENFRKFCEESFSTQGQCPADICRLDCLGGKKEEACPQVCSPRPCPAIAAEACPKKYCTLMTDCSKEKICHYQMFGERAPCGDLAYAGQDVACCEGLVRRCGVEFFDGSCDMEGENSVYALPICIPCGDSICGNFENRCNCPEDCKNPTLDNLKTKKDGVEKPGAKKSFPATNGRKSKDN